MSLEFHGLTKKYGNFCALDNFTATLDTGIYALLGPNGAGKSTLMNCLAGIIAPTDGYITYNGNDIATMGENFRAVLGFMPQYPGFYPDFTARQLMHYIGEMKGLRGKEAKLRADEMLKAVNLFDVKDKKIREFSGGMKQRVGLAQAIMNHPQVLILDEPTAGLDPKERIRFRNLISSLSKNMTVIFCTHIVSDIETIAKEVLLLHHGSLLKKDTISALTDSLEGMVWEIFSSDEAAEALIEQYPKSCLMYKDGKNCVRILNATQPCANATPCKAVLDDVYLHMFGDLSK